MQESGNMTDRIETKRLILRPWKSTDAEDLYKYASDPAVGPKAGWRPHESVENSREIIKDVLSKDETYAICLKSDNKAIGSISLRLKDETDMTDKDDECELGYWIGKPFWGNGYTPEAAKALVSRAFDELQMSVIWCGYYDGNEQSRRVQEKLGFLFHHTSYDLPVPQLNETRTGHVNILTKEQWTSSLCK